MEVKAFKLRSGEEFVAEINNKKTVGKKTKYTIENPIGPTPQGLADWFQLSASRVFEVMSDTLMFPPCEPHAEVLDLYTKQYSKIITPPNKIVGV